MKTLTITRPDDWHTHVRNGAILKNVLPHTVRQFARAIIMPNLKPPITSVSKALIYREEILKAVPSDSVFIPLMTLYLTSSTTVEEIRQVAESDFIYAIKWYPAGATTNSDSGVGDIRLVYPVLEAMQKYEIPLLVHAEVTDPNCDIFDREQRFVETCLTKVIKDFPSLRIVVEHLTTTEGVQFVQEASENIAATLTPQHLLFNRNALLAGGIRPHYYCLPILKRESHRLSLVAAATSGNPKFFLGTDSAPHLSTLKESSCGCAGCFSAHAAIELYAEIFERANALDKLEGFASFYGADFYRLPRNASTITLAKTTWTVPEFYGDQLDVVITPLLAGESLNWKLLS